MHVVVLHNVLYFLLAINCHEKKNIVLKEQNILKSINLLNYIN